MAPRKHLKFELRSDSVRGAERRQAQNNIHRGLGARLKRKYFRSNPAIYQWARETWDMDPEFLKPDANGIPKYKQTIRNALKHNKSDGSDLLTRGELIPLKKGGCCLPGHIPAGKKARPVPINREGFEIPRIETEDKPKPKTTKKKTQSSQSFPGMINSEFNAWYVDNYPKGMTSLRKQLKKAFEVAFRKGMQWVRDNE